MFKNQTTKVSGPEPKAVNGPDATLPELRTGAAVTANGHPKGGLAGPGRRAQDGSVDAPKDAALPDAPPMKHALSDNQIRCLEMLADGHEPKMIAFNLGLSPKTVEYHLAATAEKVGVSGPRKLLKWAIENGFRTIKPQAHVTSEVVQNADQLARILFRTCEDAANGKANPGQASVLCQCAGVLIDLQRLKMEIDARRHP